MLGSVTLWGHALAALLFAAVALAELRRKGAALPRAAFIVALGFTALSALAVAGIDARDVASRIAESLRDLAWLGFMFALARRGRNGTQATGVGLIYGVVAAIVVTGTTLDVALAASGAPAPGLLAASWVLRMMVAVSALVLVHHLYAAVSPGARSGIRLAVMALALLWGMDLALYATAYFGNSWPSGMVAGMPSTMSLRPRMPKVEREPKPRIDICRSWA